MLQVYSVWSLNVSATQTLQYKISLIEFPLLNCTEVFAETKSFLNKFNIDVSSSLLSKILQKSCDIVSNPSFCSFTKHEALYSMIYALIFYEISLMPDFSRR